MTACGQGCKRGGLARARGLFHAELIANAKAEEEQEDGAEDSLNGGEDFQWAGKHSIAAGIEKILAEAKDV
jgi:hypothetical protein